MRNGEDTTWATRKRNRRHALRAVLVAGVLSMFSQSASAQGTDRAFSVQNFLLAPGNDNYLTVEGASVPPHLRFRLGGFVLYQFSPLRLRECVRVEGDRCARWADDQTALISHHTSFELAAAFSFHQLLEVGLALPVVLYQTGEELEAEDGFAGVEGPRRSTGLGDLRLHLKLDLLHGLFRYKGDKFGLAFVPVFTFPTGNAAIPDSFMGHESVTVHPKLAFDFTVGRFRVGLNAGYLWRKEQQFYLAEIGPRLTYGAATEITFTEKWSGLLEVFGSSGFTPDVTSSPLEGDLAAKWKPIPTLAVLLGAGVGMLGGVGTPYVRAFGGVAWSPGIGPDKDEDGVLDEDDECPDEPEDKDGFEDSDGCPDRDNDKDGVPDTSDRCPDDPEDKDGFEDEDGCPDPDHDHDSVPNEDDKCPGEQEDVDGFEDEDGCPDPDNDGDGILDTKDACPNEAEDVDGFQDKDGCPDEDNDEDGILDVDDRCPTQKEVLNDVDDEDGCPDKGEELARLEKAQIKITQKIPFKFDSDELTLGSYRTLNVVATVLKKNPKMKIRIEGHSDSKGRSGYNLDLSQRRVDSVKAYLVKKGVAPERLKAKGYGEAKPIETNKTEAGRAANRRVEFHIFK